MDAGSSVVGIISRFADALFVGAFFVAVAGCAVRVAGALGCGRKKL